MNSNSFNDKNFFTLLKSKISSHSPEYKEEDWLLLKKKLVSENSTNDFQVKKNKNLTLRITYLAAAMIAIIIILSVFVKYQISSTNNLEYATDQYNIKSIILPDSTKVWLNKNSILTYNEKNGIRETELTGEAFFDVRKNNKKFKVITPKSVITVLGTSFNVCAYPDIEKETTTVTSGLVSVKEINNHKKETIVLEKNQACVIYRDEIKIIKEKIKDQNFLSWKTNRFEFVNTPLIEVVQTLSKHYNEEIIIEDTDLENIGLNSTFQDKEIFEIMEIIKLTLKIEYESLNEKIVLKKKNNDQSSIEEN